MRYVAWDVFETVKHADPGVEVTFSLRVMLDHIILVMEDKSTAQSYVVSNDRITRLGARRMRPPRRSLGEVTSEESDYDFGNQPYIKPDPGEAVTREYASVRNLPFIVSPEIQVDLGSTRTAGAQVPRRRVGSLSEGHRPCLQRDGERRRKACPGERQAAWAWRDRECLRGPGRIEHRVAAPRRPSG